MNNRTMNFISGVGVGLGAGLGISALFGPNGGRNRSLIRDKAVHYGHETGDFLTKASRDLVNRSKGLLHPKKDRGNRKLDILQSNWSPATKLLVGSAALGVGIYSIASLAKHPEAFKTIAGTIRDALKKVEASIAPGEMEMRSNEERYEPPVPPIETYPSGLAASRNTGAGTAENQVSG